MDDSIINLVYADRGKVSAFTRGTTVRKTIVYLLLLAVIVSGYTPLFGVPSAFAADNTTHSDMVAASNHSLFGEIIPGEVLVKYKTPRTAKNGFGIQSFTPRIQKLSFPASIEVADKIRELQMDPNVELVEPIYKVMAAGVTSSQTVNQSVYYNPANPTYMQNWGKTVTQLTYAAEFTTAQRLNQVVVAVIDSGVSASHPGLSGSILTGYDFVNKDANPADDHGHGTMVAGIIAAKVHSGSDYSGVASGAKIMPIKVLDNRGFGNTADLVAGIQYAITNHAQIINMSLGSYGNSQILHEVIQDAVAANILVVAAAGNDSNNWLSDEPGQFGSQENGNIRYAEDVPSYPARYEEVISVGAIAQLADMSLAVADFSNTYKVDVAAPGVNIYTTDRFNSYSYFSGTSAAAPFVAALAALVIANDPSIQLNHLKSLIEYSTTSMPALELSYSNVSRNNSNTLSNFDFYGHGLLNGRNPFTQARLELTLDLSRVSVDHTVIAMMSEKDAFGQPAAGNHTYTLFNQRVVEDTPYRFSWASDDLGMNGTVIQSVYGSGSVALTLPGSMNDSYGYRFYLDDDGNGAEKAVQSNWSYWYKRPAPPQPDQGSGSYTGSVNVQLSSSTPNSHIYYTLINSSSDGRTYPYTSSVNINKSSVLLTYALKNNIFSEDAAYSYTILTGGSGGGGIFIPPMPAPTPSPAPKDPNGGVITPDAEELMKQIDSPTGQVVLIQSNADPAAMQWTLELSGSLLQKAANKQKALEIRSTGVQLLVPPGAFMSKDEETAFHLKTTLHPEESSAGISKGANTELASPIYEFSLSNGELIVDTFDKPLRATFTYDNQKVKNADRLAVYYFNEKSQQWEYIGGTVNSNNTVTAELSHFSKYAVMESNKTFDDISTHWAKAEIEKMADQQIIVGITDHLFQPEQNVTRAQFVTLLARALELPAAPDHANKFKDVASDAWYSSNVYAAYQANIVSGIEESLFAPEAMITREQMAVLVVKAYLYNNNLKLSDLVGTQEVKYSDEGAVSDWARIYVRTASSLGLMSGDEQRRFNPELPSSRAQAAVVLFRLLKLNSSL